MNAYLEQIHRVKRYLLRLQKGVHGTIGFEDDLWSFFQNCWHLKDWIKNDPSTPTSIASIIEDDVKASRSISICADLANRSKHLRLDRRRHDANLAKRETRANHYSSAGARVGESRGWRYIVTLDDGSTRDALQVAQDAVKDWENIVCSYGLLWE